MISTAIPYSSSLTAHVAGEHLNDLLREAAASRARAQLPIRDRHRTPRQRALWWDRVTAPSVTP